MKPFTIVTGEGNKGRSFGGTLLAYVTSSLVSENSGYSHIYPIWAVAAVSRETARPIAYSFREGNGAKVENKYLKFPEKGLDVRFDLAEVGEGTMISLYHPELVRAGATHARLLRFAAIIRREEAAAVAWDRDSVQAYLKRLGLSIPEGSLDLVPYFAHYFNARSRLPVPRDLRFYGQLLSVFLSKGWAAVSSYDNGPCSAYGLESLGILPALVVKAKHEDIRETVALEIGSFTMNGGKIG